MHFSAGGRYENLEVYAVVQSIDETIFKCDELALAFLRVQNLPPAFLLHLDKILTKPNILTYKSMPSSFKYHNAKKNPPKEFLPKNSSQKIPPKKFLPKNFSQNILPIKFLTKKFLQKILQKLPKVYPKIPNNFSKKV